MNNYRIVECGILGTGYHIQERVLWVFWWTVNSSDPDYGDHHPDHYKTIEEAEAAIEYRKNAPGQPPTNGRIIKEL